MKVDTIKIQKEICNAMLNRNARLTCGEIENDTIAVTVNGFAAYALPKSECIFDIKKIPTRNDIQFAKLFERNQNDKLLTVTPLTVDMMNGGNKTTLRRLTCEDFDCFVDVRLLKQLEDGNLYGYDRLGRILVQDDFGCPLAVIMPTRYELEY